MIQLIISLVFLVDFYRSANEIGKNKFLWAFIGLCSFFATSYGVQVVLVLSMVIMHKTGIISTEPAMVLSLVFGLVGIVIGVFAALYVKNNILLAEEKNRWQNDDSLQDQPPHNISQDDARTPYIDESKFKDY